MSRMGGGPDDPGEADAAAVDRGDDAAEVERNVQEDREGEKESTTTSFTKDSTADESLSNYDNFSDMDFSFEARRVGRRDANDVVGDYIARVAGIEMNTDRDRLSQREGVVADRAASEANALAAARMDRTQFSDSSTYGADWMAAQEQARQDEAIAIRTDWESPSLVDEWGMTQDIRTASESPYDASRRALTDTDLDRLTRESEQDRYGLLGSEGALDAARRANAVARVQAGESAEQATINTQMERARLDKAIRIDTENNSKVIKQAEEVIKDPLASSDEKNWAHEVHRSLRQGNKTMRKDGRIVSEIASAVHDPKASALAKDNQTIREFRELNSAIDKIANRPFFNTGWEYTKHDPKTTRQVQALIERYESVFMDNLSNMGKRNSKAINDKGFDMSKGLGIMGSNVIQGIMNKLGWAYHATDTEKQLRALRVKWGLDEPDTGDGPNIDDLKRRCNERSGYKWDEETNSCIPISNLNTDYRQYLPD
mgnify:CR=1 FL=1